MIVHQILKKSPSITDRIFGRRQQQQQVEGPVRSAGNLVLVSDQTPASNLGDLYLSKLQYSKFVEHTQIKMPVGTLVTFRSFPIVPGRKEPIPCYLVDFYQEIQHQAAFDPKVQEYRIVGCKPFNMPAPYQFIAPFSLRCLTTEEQHVANASNSKE